MMFTPQRKVLSGWFSPGSDKNGSGYDNSDPNSNPTEKGIASNGGGVMDQEILTNKISELEKELYEYQYNMGLLLIEKKEWTSKNEQLQQALSGTKEILEREQTTRVIAISEVEKREEKLRSALGIEKQCVHELEKALHEMRSEIAEIKFTAESKLEEANTLSSIVEERSLQVEAKFHAADAKLAEVSRKASEVQRKSAELEAKENSLLREHVSVTTEREANERHFAQQREDLREWEMKLQQEEKRLAEARRLLNQREERANESDTIYKKKLLELGETQKMIDLALSDLKTKEDDMSSRIANLTSKEKEVDDMRNALVTKEKELVELEEKLKEREQIEIKKIRDEHKIILDAKQHDLELEMEQKIKSLDDSFKSKVMELEKRELEVKHSEAVMAKREQAIENKMEKLKEKEKDFDSKSKYLKQIEKSLKVDEKNLEVERNQIRGEKDMLLGLETELQKLRTEFEEQQLKVIKEEEKLRVTQEERSEHIRLQLELKQEIEKNKQEGEAFFKERDDLKRERDRFEKEWEDLDEKKAEIQRELESLAEQKERTEKWNRLEEERLNNQRLETRAYVEKELEALKLANDSFTANLEHERSALAEKYQSENSKILQDFEVRRQELEIKYQNREVEIENSLRERERLFAEKKDRELTDIRFLRDVARTEMEEMKLQRSKLEKEKQEIFANQKHLETQQLEMKKDIDNLINLSMKLKDQREQFFNERERLISFVEKQKDCVDCGPMISEFMLSDLQCLEVKDAETFTLPRIAEGYLKEAVKGTPEKLNINKSVDVSNSVSPASGTTMSWLQKCTSKIFIFSAGKKNERAAAENSTGSAEAQEKLVDVGEIPQLILSSEDEPEGSGGVAMDSFDIQGTRSYNIEEVSKQPNGNEGESKLTRRGRTKAGFRKAIVGRRTARANSGSEDTVYTNEEDSQGESDLIGKEKSEKGKKRNWKRTSNGECSDGGANGGRRNRRRKDAPVVEAPQQKRYNLRPSKIAAPSANIGASSNPSRREEVDGVEVDSSFPPGRSASFTNGNHAADSQADEIAKNKVVEDDVSCDEINGTPQQNREREECDDKGTPEAQEEEEDSEDEDEHPGEVSIGRKLWTFIST